MTKAVLKTVEEEKGGCPPLYLREITLTKAAIMSIPLVTLVVAR